MPQTLMFRHKLSVKSFLNGKQIEGFDLREGHSWVRNAYNGQAFALLNATAAGGTFGDGFLNNKTTGGSLSTGMIGWNWAGGASAVTGIVVGTGSTAWTFEDYKLDTLIAHGNSADQLSYTATDTRTDAFVGDVVTTTATRTFNNNSGGAIEINEVGLYTGIGGTSMLNRDVLVSPVSVPDAGQLVVTYQISPPSTSSSSSP